MVSMPPQSLAVSRLVVDTSILFCLLIAQKIGSEEHARWESEMQKTERAARYNLVQALYRSQLGKLLIRMGGPLEFLGVKSLGSLPVLSAWKSKSKLQLVIHLGEIAMLFSWTCNMPSSGRGHYPMRHLRWEVGESHPLSLSFPAQRSSTLPRPVFLLLTWGISSTSSAHVMPEKTRSWSRWKQGEASLRTCTRLDIAYIH